MVPTVILGRMRRPIFEDVPSLEKLEAKFFRASTPLEEKSWPRSVLTPRGTVVVVLGLMV